MHSLSNKESARYARNLLIPGFGECGQERLRASRVLVVGLGGLGSPVAFYLAAAGVGTLGLLDSDAVELSNLQRQILHTTARIGLTKTQSAAETIAALNPDIQTELHAVRLSSGNAEALLRRYDVVVEACDNFETKFLINDVCVRLGKPFATAGILAMSGQAMFVVPGRTACLRCATPDVPTDVPTTGVLGVLGATPGVLGSLQALETVRWLAGLWRPETDGAALLHAVSAEGSVRMRTMRIPQRPGCVCVTCGTTANVE